MKTALKTLWVLAATTFILSGCDLDKNPIKTPPPSDMPEKPNNSN